MLHNLAWTARGAILGAIIGAILADSPGVAGERMIAAQDVLAAITADWTGDGGMDRAVLVDNRDGMADLLIYSEQDGTMTLAAVSEALAWIGSAWGTLPEIALSPNGALQVVSMNEAIGRHRWRETLTVVYREGRFIVGGYTYRAYDTLDLDYEYGCDINLITGMGVFNNAAFRSPIDALPVGKWGGDGITSPDLCPAN